MRLRGRKGIREALERQPDLIILNPGEYRGKWHDHFGNSRPIHIELGMGKGRFVSELSARNPAINYIGIDMYDELLRRAAEKARLSREEHPGATLDNLALVLMNIGHIDEVFAPDEVERVYLNFSDPWPKTRHAGRRLTHPGFVQKYLTFLNERGEIHFKTDSQALFEFSLNSFADQGLRMRNISLHLHREGLRDDLVLTEYEAKFVEQGMNIYRCEVVTGERALAEHLAKLPHA